MSDVLSPGLKTIKDAPLSIYSMELRLPTSQRSLCTPIRESTLALFKMAGFVITKARRYSLQRKRRAALPDQPGSRAPCAVHVMHPRHEVRDRPAQPDPLVQLRGRH